jgi:hypothetical protein
LAIVESGRLTGAINKKGEFVIELQRYSLGDFNDGIALVRDLASDPAKQGYIDKTGRYIWPPTW